MRWTRLEYAIAAKLIRYPCSTTPRERTLTLFSVRLALLGPLSTIAGMLLLALGALPPWYPLQIAGAVLFAAGLSLLVVAMAFGTILIIIYGDYGD